jgi:hypothetical protein
MDFALARPPLAPFAACDVTGKLGTRITAFAYQRLRLGRGVRIWSLRASITLAGEILGFEHLWNPALAQSAR